MRRGCPYICMSLTTLMVGDRETHLRLALADRDSAIDGQQ